VSSTSRGAELPALHHDQPDSLSCRARGFCRTLHWNGKMRVDDAGPSAVRMRPLSLAWPIAISKNEQIGPAHCRQPVTRCRRIGCQLVEISMSRRLLLLPLLLILAARADADSSASSAKLWRGIDLAGMDPTKKPWEDFYGYANGGWLARFELPP